jgi:beta-glucosidase
MALSLAPLKGLGSAEIAARIDAIMAEATLAEKVGMMSGKGFFADFKADAGVWAARPYRAGGGIDRLDVPAFWFTDGPRGVARGNSTCFPCTMARGASFDVDLERRIGEAMGIETRAQGCNLNGAVCVNLLRHPAWGRAQETYGEDPCHLGLMGAALGTGIQAHNVCATVKHLALNSMENARFRVDVTIDERSLHEIYLPHFKTILDAGVMSVMSAYNQMNGEYCGQNHHLLTDILRGEWGFAGFVHSDWVMGVYKPYGAAAGLDIENPEPLVFGEKLIAAVEAGTIATGVIDTACRRILTSLYAISCAQDPLPDYPLTLVANDRHVALAHEAAVKSAVLLANDGVLPLDPGIGRLAVLGRLAALPNTGDNGSSRVRPPEIITALAGLTARLGADRIMAADESDLAAAAVAAAHADAVVVVVGYTAQEEGEFIPGDIALGQENALDPAEDTLPKAVTEARKRRKVAIGGDRSDLGLPAAQLQLIDVAIASGRPVIIVIVAGSAVIVEGWHDRVGAILQTFYSGMAGGTALAALLFGSVSPAGRLPFTMARAPADYPAFDRDAVAVTYDYWHGYAKLARDSVAARYAFGHGLSYSRFETRALRLRRAGDRISGSVAVVNTGTMAADHVVLLWAEAPAGSAPRWPRRLVGFARTTLAPGETHIVPLEFSLAALAHRDPATHGWQAATGEWRFVLAETAEAASAQSVTLAL